MEHHLSALLQLHLYSQLSIRLHWIGQRQLQEETRNISVLGFGVAYIRNLTVVCTGEGNGMLSTHCGLVKPYGWHRCESTVAQIMACCLMAQSHYLNWCWLIISTVHWLRAVSLEICQPSTIKINLKITQLKCTSNLPGDNELIDGKPLPEPVKTKMNNTITWLEGINTLKPRKHCHHFTDDIFKHIFLNENVWILFKISLKFVPKVWINNISTLVQIMAWHQPGTSHDLNQ